MFLSSYVTRFWDSITITTLFIGCTIQFTLVSVVRLPTLQIQTPVGAATGSRQPQNTKLLADCHYTIQASHIYALIVLFLFFSLLSLSSQIFFSLPFTATTLATKLISLCVCVYVCISGSWLTNCLYLDWMWRVILLV